MRANVLGISGGKKGIGFKEFSNFLIKLKESVYELEFNVLDENGDGAISSDQFARSMLSYSNIKDVDKYLSRIEGMGKTGFTKKQFLEWYKVFECIEEINTAINLFVTSGQPYTPKKFKKTAKIISGYDLDVDQIKIVFALFDKDGDGRISNEEFSKIISKRNKRGLQSSSISENKKSSSSFFDLFSCSVNCFKDEILDRSSR